uniref:CCHC-type domain-containing protein n=1 Tax=Vitis vinifera TaxID=29760 RepID=A5ACU4_VITVI|nr:hypothetical protein VITISV_034115 [Vitis vinifera]
MTEDRDVSYQIHDHHLLINDLAIEDTKLLESFVAGYLVETIPESWKDYKNNMKHKRKQMFLEDVIIHIRIEEQNLNRDNIEKAKELSSKANVVEEKSKPKNNRSRKQNSQTKPNASNKVHNSTIKKWGNCFVCGKSGHHAPQCRHRKRIEKSNSKANLAEAEVITIVISFEVSMVTNMKDWVVDSRATRHICGKKSAFTSYTTLKEGEEQVFMGDSRSTLVIGKGKVLLKLTFGKVLVLNDVFHVPDIRWNMVLVSLLGKAGVRILFDFDKIVLTKNDAFVGNGYCNQDFFEKIFHVKLNGEQQVQKTSRDKSIEPSKFEPRRSKRDRKETNLGDGFYTFLIDEDPRSYKEVITSPDAPFWKEAINSEIESIMYNHTWKLVDLPPGGKTIGYYFDTFAPATRITSIRVLIALASIHNLVIHQMDVKTAFLNGDLEEEIYMEQPSGCVVLRKKKKVCKLVKSQYGLKQAPKQWHNKFDHVLITNGYSNNDVDKCIYNKYEDNTCVVIYLYVNDMLIFGTSLEILCEIKKFLGSKFDMKDLRETDVILRIKITRTPYGLKLSQEHYVEKILRKFEHFDCKPVSTLYDPSS